MEERKGEKRKKNDSGLVCQMLFHTQICADSCFFTVVHPSVREMLPAVGKSGSFESVLLAEAAAFLSGVSYKAVCGTWQQV